MGLDVNLYEITHREAWEREVALEAQNPRHDFDQASTERSHETDSPLDPTHLFKVGYWRSSYNEAGFNSVVGALCDGKDLHWVIDLTKECYRVFPDWAASLTRAKGLLAFYRERNAQMGGCRVSIVSASSLGTPPRSASDATAIFREQVTRDADARKLPRHLPWHMTNDGEYANWYGCKDGNFYFGPAMKVRAFVPGTNFGQPCLYVVHEPDHDEGADWYETAFKIVIETIGFVLTKPNPQDFYLHWSG